LQRNRILTVEAIPATQQNKGIATESLFPCSVRESLRRVLEVEARRELYDARVAAEDLRRLQEVCVDRAYLVEAGYESNH
jgi:hypothetical protein